jgi:hypothetical protein
MIRAALEDLRKRRLADGGFAHRPGGQYRSDATGWAILVLSATDPGSSVVDAARSRIAKDQLQDGSVPISPDHPDAFWPTALAALAWQSSPPYREVQTRAIRFLIRVTGLHPKPQMPPPAHDTSIQGWPWVKGTHSWVEPTALAMIALIATGYGVHGRVQEATRMLLNRQLPSGGWNVGAPFVYGNQTRPDPENTGIALSSLAHTASKEQVNSSIRYLNSSLTTYRTPLALGWSVLGLHSWQESPASAENLIFECLQRQTRYGPYDTASLSTLLMSALAPAGLLRHFAANG